MWFRKNFAGQQSKLSGVFTANKIIQYLQIKLCVGVYTFSNESGSYTGRRRMSEFPKCTNG
jgi:hypothetical protein